MESRRMNLSTGWIYGHLLRNWLLDNRGQRRRPRRRRKNRRISRRTERWCFVEVLFLHWQYVHSAMILPVGFESIFHYLISEILAVSTFADEINLFLPDSPSNYIQLWTFDPALKSNPECSVLLETPRCTVLALSWCPVLVDHPDKCLKSRKKNDRCLGLLAAATDKGVVFIYR